ncbi:hypothetical protein [Streptomyces luteireticuli]|uniref:hypothetical protein n=1 Tax=Streptomyces luteireticuli TaxID=173858 RepID=UPI00355781E6
MTRLDLTSPWDEPDSDPAASALASLARRQMRKATEGIRERGYPKVLFADVAPAQRVNARNCSPEHPGAPEPLEEPEGGPDVKKLGSGEAQAAIEDGWAKGFSIRETARRATRAPSYVHSVFVKLDSDRGGRPPAVRRAQVNGQDEAEPEKAASASS